MVKKKMEGLYQPHPLYYSGGVTLLVCPRVKVYARLNLFYIYERNELKAHYSKYLIYSAEL